MVPHRPAPRVSRQCYPHTQGDGQKGAAQEQLLWPFETHDYIDHDADEGL